MAGVVILLFNFELHTAQLNKLPTLKALIFTPHFGQLRDIKTLTFETRGAF